MILDIKWQLPENGRGDAKLMALVAEIAGWDECGDIKTTGRTFWEEVRIERKQKDQTDG